MKAGKLVKGRDDGGERYYLNDRPVHCGDALELRLPGDRWTRVRYEMSFSSAGAFEPVLHLYVGREIDQRFEVRPTRGRPLGSAEMREMWRLHDLERDIQVRLTDRDRHGRAAWPELDADTFFTRAEAAEKAAELNGLYNGALEVLIHEWTKCVLRWPGSGR